MKKYLLPLIAVFAMSYAVISVIKSQPKKISEPPPVTPPQTNLIKTIAGVGLVESASENIAVSTPVSGLVTQVFVKAGQHVTKGQKLFALDDRDLRAELEVKKNQLMVAQTKLDKLKQGTRPEEIFPVEARVSEAETALADANVQVKLMESVTDRRAIRDEDLQRRRLAAKAAEARLEQAKAQLALLKAGSWQPDIQVANKEVALAQATIKRIETDIERLTICAQTAGVILQCNVRAGEFASAGQLPRPLLLLGDLSNFHVRVDVDENNAQRVNATAKAEGSLRGSPHKIRLEFVRVEPYVVPKKSLTNESAERVDTRVLQIIYRLKETQIPVYVGQQMDVFIAEGDTTDNNKGGVE